MKTAEIGVLVHGAGWVSTQHIEAYKRNPSTRVVAVSSRTLEGAKKRVVESQLKDVTCYDQLESALDQPGIDVVSICTPQHVHFENVQQAAAAGKHLVVEKPVGNSLFELRKMRDLVRKKGIRTIVSFVLRWNPMFQKIKKIIAGNGIGRPYYLETDYLSHNGSWWGGWNHGRTLERGVSALLVGGCHAVDALRWFAAPEEFEAADPTEVFSLSGGYRKGRTKEYNPLTHTWSHSAPPMEYDGLEVVLVKFNNGAMGKVTVNNDCIMPYRFPVRIFGDLGTVFDRRVWSPESPGPTVWKELGEIPPDSSDVSDHPFQRQIDHFIDCLKENRESHCNLEDALKTHEIIFAAIESQKTGQTVKLPIL